MIYSLSNDTWNEDEIKAVHDVINSRHVTMGDYVKNYENNFAEKFGGKYAVMSNSGSSANLLAIASLVYSGRLKKGDEVLVTAVSWSTTYFPLSQMGLKIRLIDININTLNVDISLLEDAITDNTKAIMTVNLLGNPNNYKDIKNICQRYKLILLEDNCESMGASYDGKMTGTFGIIGTYSTYYSHHLCTMEGGMCLTDDKELYEYMLSIRSHGWTRHLPVSSSIYKKQKDSFYENFNFIMPGFNLRPLEIEAAIGIEQLKKLDNIIRQRRKNAEYFINGIKETDLLVQKEIGISSWFGFAIILPPSKAGYRKNYIEALALAQIETRPIVAGNFAKQRALDYLDYSIFGNLINADYIHENGFFVGNHSVNMKEEIDLLINTLKAVIF